jgi:hypothetical protein
LGHALAAAALNYLKAGEWFSGTPRAPARVPPFVSLVEGSAA